MNYVLGNMLNHFNLNCSKDFTFSCVDSDCIESWERSSSSSSIVLHLLGVDSLLGVYCALDSLLGIDWGLDTPNVRCKRGLCLGELLMHREGDWAIARIGDLDMFRIGDLETVLRRGDETTREVESSGGVFANIGADGDNFDASQISSSILISVSSV